MNQPPQPPAHSLSAARAALSERQPHWPAWLGLLVGPIGLLLVALLGLLLRRYRLGAYGLWFDEADLVARARQSLPELLTAFIRPGENGPLYTLLLAVWLKLAEWLRLGDGEIVVRLPAMLAGALAVPVLVLLGRQLGGWWVGLLAGLLLAISPYAVWYSQDAKMYALLTLLGPASWLLLLLALERRGGGWWLAYGALVALSFTIHVSSLLVWFSQIVVVALAWRRLGPGRSPWLITTLALLLPLLIIGGWPALSLLDSEPIDVWHPAVSPLEMLGVLAVKLAMNRADPTLEVIGAAIYAGLAGLGLLAWRHWPVGDAPQVATSPARSAEGPVLPPALLLGGASVVPLVIFLLVTLRIPLFQDRYLIVLLPPYLLLIAGALAAAGRWRWPALALGLTLLLGLAWMPLREVVFAADAQKEDWLGAYRYIDAHVREGDVLLIHPGYLRTTADYYQRRFPALARLPVVTLPSLGSADFGERELDMALAERERTWGKTRVWLVTSPERLASDDRRNLLRIWYHGNTLLFADRRFNGVQVETFSYNGPFKAGQWRPEIPLRVDFGDEISLLGATWDLDPQHTVRAGDWALLTLRWRLLRPTSTNYVVRVRLRDTGGREVAAYDIEPLDGHWPTSRWSSREQTQGMVWDYHDLFIEPTLPAGRYSVAVGLYPVDAPAAGLRPSSDALTDDPLAVSVGTLQIVR